MNNSNSRRWWMTGISAVCLVGVTSLWAADPTTAPSVTTGAPSVTAGAPSVTAGAPPAASAGAPAVPDRSNDQSSNNNRRNRGRNTNGNGNNYGGRSAGGSAGVISPNDPYGVLQVRSIFVKGNQSLIKADPPVRTEIPRPTAVSHVAENLLVFNGVTVVNELPEAFVEDLRSNVVVTVKLGDSIAGGTVAAISFDDLSYLVHGQIRHVGLGDDFTGNAAYSLAPPSTAPSGPAPIGQVVGAGASIPPVAAPTQSGMSTEDTLARMKAKRAQESQQIGK